MARIMIALVSALIVLGCMSAATADAQGSKPPSTAAAVPEQGIAAVNAFNRLLEPPGKRNPPPAKDGIHDPDSPGTAQLQAPREAFKSLPKGNSGNRVDWVRAAESGKIRPIWDGADHKKQPEVLDLDIVRQVKGSMPDVVFPHNKHTALLDCSACHPAIFQMQQGANKMSMASIMLGNGCGTCHGRVAFPVSECRLCHSRNKKVRASK